jgi:hypothetical protein
VTTIQALKTFLTAPESKCNFSQLNTLISDKNIHLGITFWGERVITVQGEEGSVSLYALANKVLLVIEARCLSPAKWPSDEVPDKVAATLVVIHLDEYLSQTDTFIARTKNYFTWILAKIRDNWLSAPSVRSDIGYLHCWGFKVGYKIQRCPFWGYDDVPDWVPRKPREPSL